MKTCSNCNTPNRDTAKFCQNCASPLEATIYCPHCGSGNSPTAKYCVNCANPMPSAGMYKTGTLPLGTIMNDRYRILGRLGRGGMGAVYLTTDTRLGDKKCALKEMSEAALIDQGEIQLARSAFEQEARLLSTLTHPNLPRVTDFFAEGGKQYLVMDFVEGTPLDELLENQTIPFDQHQVMRWAEQLCKVLSYLHNHSPPIIFRDLKPGNIMVSPDKQTIKLIDFGIARLFKPGAIKDTVYMGTPGYAPPEQYGRGQSDERSDVYALGATLHQLLTLRDPGDEPFRFPPLRSLNPRVSPHIEAAIQRALEQEPFQRWPSTLEFWQALEKPVRTPIRTPARPEPHVVTPVGGPPSVDPSLAAAPPVVPDVVQPPAETFAENGPRIGAYFVDNVIIGIGSFLLLIPFAEPIDYGDPAATLLYFFLSLLWPIGYFTYFHSRSGQTPGKKLVKIKVVRRNGDPLTRNRAFWRVIAMYISNLTMIGALLPLFHRENRALHDLLADTWVVRT